MTDLDFAPTNTNLIATGCEDTIVRVWTIPEGGVPTSGISDGAVELHGHGRKISELFWNPFASGILASSSLDQTIKVWDVEKHTAAYDLTGLHNDVIQSFVWNNNGNLIASQSRDKKVRVFDVRSKSAVHTTDSHPGVKTAKVVFSNSKNWVISTGFGKGSDRQLLGWDLRNITKPVAHVVIDQSSGVLIPHLDEATQILFVASKGESSIRYYEVTSEKPFVHFISNFGEGVPTRGIAFLPKIYNDAAHCEVERIYKLTSKDTIEPISFTVPRRSEMFQNDIFPPVVDTSKAGLTGSQWLAGENSTTAHLLSYGNDGTPIYSTGPFPNEDVGTVASSVSSAATSSSGPAKSAPAAGISFAPASSSATGDLERRLGQLEKIQSLEKEVAEKDAQIAELKAKIAELEQK